jgi:RNA polymerase sigma-70 factor, ECF subfamily
VATGSSDWRAADLEIVHRARNGDPGAFHDLVDQYARFLYSLALSLTSSNPDAEDLVQETLAGAFRGLGSFEGRSSLKTWLARILIRQNARRHRSAGTRPAEVPLDEAAEAEDIAQTTPSQEATETRIDIMAAIRALRPDSREIIVLREVEGLSYDEIAEVLDVPRGTVESRLFRARRQLQERLKDYIAD